MQYDQRTIARTTTAITEAIRDLPHQFLLYCSTSDAAYGLRKSGDHYFFVGLPLPSVSTAELVHTLETVGTTFALAASLDVTDPGTTYRVDFETAPAEPPF